jgi:hypothetical protein
MPGFFKRDFCLLGGRAGGWFSMAVPGEIWGFEKVESRY